ncbi:hypothetical protein PVL29_002791 [Vitis rotundifolia]|uniref:Uncharacterized protein n=1 Tax=Vitis rotundifolia TaxID=103349 RepID=A0AA39ABC1_VITRO|nr:hypothetical protein PVL29_002791 [Vitis rotundifolia]
MSRSNLMRAACHAYGDFGKGTLESSYHTFTKSEDYNSSEMHGIRKLKPRKSMENEYCRLQEETDSDEEQSPFLGYLSTYGLEESHFIRMYERHVLPLQISLQIPEYSVNSNLKSHVVFFLVGLSIPDSRMRRVVAAAPYLFSYSVENSSKPTVRQLVKEDGDKKNDMGSMDGRSSRSRIVDGEDEYYNLVLKFNEAVIGVEKEIEITRLETCGTCNGSGAKAIMVTGQYEQRGIQALRTPCCRICMPSFEPRAIPYVSSSCF